MGAGFDRSSISSRAIRVKRRFMHSRRPQCAEQRSCKTMNQPSGAGEFSRSSCLANARWRDHLRTRMTCASRPSEVVTKSTRCCRNASTRIRTSDKSCALSAEVRLAAVTHLNDALLAQLDLPQMESFWFAAADGTKVQGFLIRPPASTPTRNTPSNSSSTAARKAHGATPGPTAGTPNSSPPTATSSS